MATLPSDHSCASLSPELTLLRTPEPPYYAVISINIHHGKDMDIYNEQLQKTYEVANTLPGYLCTEAAKEVREDVSVYAVATLMAASS